MPSFPDAIATDVNLFVALDNKQTTLASVVGSGDTSLSVVSGSAIASNVIVTIGNEKILLGTVAGTAASGCTRGHDGTTPAAHSVGALVFINVVRDHHEALKNEIIAMQTAIGKSMRNVLGGIQALSYRFSVTPLVALTAGIPASVTLAALPDGINATDSPNNHYIYLTDGVGGNEVVPITGVAGLQVAFTPALSHISGNWAMGSATSGLQEAHYANHSGIITLRNGSYTISPVYLKYDCTFQGEDRQFTKLYARTTSQDFFKWVGGWGYSYQSWWTFRNLHFENAQGGATPHQVAGSAIDLSDGHGRAYVTSCFFSGCFNAVKVRGVSTWCEIKGCWSERTVNHAWWIGGTVALSELTVTPSQPGANAYYSSTGILQANYADGRYNVAGDLCPSLIYIEGGIGGMLIDTQWTQACYVNLQISAYLHSTTITAAIADAVATAMVLASATGLAAGSIVIIGTEQIKIGALAGLNASGCTRGVNGTTAASHLINAGVTVQDRKCNEIVVSNCIFDQDGPEAISTANVSIGNDYGTVLSTSNSIQVRNCFMSGASYCLYAYSMEHIYAGKNYMKNFGTSRPLVAVVNCNKVNVDGNDLCSVDSSNASAILLRNLTVGYGDDLVISRNKFRKQTGSGIPAFIELQMVDANRVQISDNRAMDVAAFISNTGTDATTLALALADAVGTTVTLTSGANVAGGGVVTIGTEQILLGVLTGNVATLCTRGYNGSTAAAHINGSAVSFQALMNLHHKFLVRGNVDEIGFVLVVSLQGVILPIVDEAYVLVWTGAVNVQLITGGYPGRKADCVVGTGSGFTFGSASVNIAASKAVAADSAFRLIYNSQNAYWYVHKSA